MNDYINLNFLLPLPDGYALESIPQSSFPVPYQTNLDISTQIQAVYTTSMDFVGNSGYDIVAAIDIMTTTYQPVSFMFDIYSGYGTLCTNVCDISTKIIPSQLVGVKVLFLCDIESSI